MLGAYQFSGFFQQAAIGAANLQPLFWREDLGFSEGAIGLLNGVGSAIAVAGPILFGIWGSRFLPHRLVGWCFALSALVFPAMLVLRGFVPQTIAFGISQFLKIGFLTLVPVGVLHLLGESAGQDYGRYRRSGSAGFLVGTVAAGYLAQGISNQAILWTVSLGYALAAVPFFRGIRIPTPRAPEDRYALVWHDPLLRNFLIGTIFFSTWLAPAFTFLPLRLRELNASAGWIGWIISLCGVIAFVSLSWLGRKVDHGDPRRLYLIGIAGAVVRALALALPTTMWPFLFLQVLHIPTWVLGEVCQIRIVRDHAPPSMFPRVQALLQISTYLGIALGSWWGGLFAEFWGLRAGLAASAVLPLIGLPFLLRVVQLGDAEARMQH